MVHDLERRAYTYMSYMKEYLIWAGEKLQALTGWDWENCMDYLTSDKDNAITQWLSMKNYLKEAKNGN